MRSSGNRACVFQPGDTYRLSLRCRLEGGNTKSRNGNFRQVNKNEPRKHHDALEFPDGRIVLLTRLSEGQKATVLQLPAQPTTAAEADAQKRIAYVR